MFDVIAATNMSSRNMKDMMTRDTGVMDAIQRQTGGNIFNLTIGGKCTGSLIVCHCSAVNILFLNNSLALVSINYKYVLLTEKMHAGNVMFT